MELVNFESLNNGGWYVIPGHYNDTPSRIYKLIYKDVCYIKAIATNFDQDIIKVPCNQAIFKIPMSAEGMDDQEDLDHPKVYLAKERQNEFRNFISYDPDPHFNLTNSEKSELYKKFNEIEKELQKGGKRKKKRKTKRKRKINKRKKSKTKNYMH
jgi:hypothetical protein